MLPVSPRKVVSYCAHIDVTHMLKAVQNHNNYISVMNGPLRYMSNTRYMIWSF